MVLEMKHANMYMEGHILPYTSSCCALCAFGTYIHQPYSWSASGPYKSQWTYY